MSVATLGDILEASHPINAALNITGLFLLYANNFVWVLKGPRTTSAAFEAMGPRPAIQRL